MNLNYLIYIARVLLELVDVKIANKVIDSFVNK